MKKKLIGLSILLLVLLLGLSTTSYADELTEDNIKNFVYNASVEFGSPINDSVFERQNYINWYNAISNVINTKDFFLYANWGESSDHNVDLQITLQTFSNFNSVWTYNSNSGYFYIRGQYQGAQNFRYNVSTNTYTYRADYDSVCAPKGIWFTTRNIYDFNNTSTLLYSAPYAEPSNIFDGPYSALAFAFVTDPGLGTVTYDNYEYTLFNKPSSGDILLGQLFIPNGIVVNYADILNYYWYWNNWQVRSLTDDSIRTQLVSNNDGDLVFNVFLKRNYIYNNTYYQYIFTSTQTEPYQFVSGGCYIKDNHTVITNGVVDPNNTFSGDYKDQYDSIIDNQQDVDNISEAIDDTILDDSEVDDMLSEFNSSGDILDSLGYSPVENPFTTVILDVVTQLTDVLLGSGDVTLDISAFDLEMELHSVDFKLPNGLIKIFVSLVSNGFMIWIIYKYGFKLYMEINTGKFKNLIDETTNTNINLF